MVLRTARNCGRRCAATLRSLSPFAAAALTLAVVFGGVGIAGAATGGTFILGRANSETSTAILSNSRGIPLSLSAPTNTAPLAVNRQALVKNLNAQFVGGQTASQLQATGGDGFTVPGQETDIFAPTVVVSTGSLPAGTYYVTATAQVGVPIGDTGAGCYLAPGSDPSDQLQVGGSTATGSISTFIQAAETVAVSVPKGGTLEELCHVDGTVASAVNNAGITAIRIVSSSGTAPIHT